MKSIDAMIATHVMKWERKGGWPVTPNDSTEYGCWATGTHPSHGGRVRWCEPDSEGLDSLNDAEVWSPSTDPAAMMVVVEKMREHGWLWEANNYSDGRHVWSAEFGNGTQATEGNAPSLALAVSIAALRACAVPESDIAKALEER